MTVSRQNPVNSSTGNGATTVFPYNFRILAAGDLEVTVDGVVQTLNTHYSLTGVGSASGGNVTFVTAPASGKTVIRRRNMPLTRTTDYQYQGDLPNSVLNADQDAPVMMIQQLQDQIDRAPKVPVGESAPGPLPAVADRAGKFAGYDADGNPVALAGTGGGDSALRTDLAAGTGSSLVGHVTPEGEATSLGSFVNQIVSSQGFEFLAAKMAAGFAVKIAIYGDSTDDGNATTGWTPNPTSGGAATGAGAHTPPNAWPAKLQAILRAMFSNSQIQVWNAGYSGQELSNGWAYNNYATAVLNNPGYGLPDATILGFGLNDIDAAGSDFENHRIQLLRLGRRIIADGTVLILRTCDPIARNLSASRDHKEAVREIDQVKFWCASTLRVPIIDMGTELRRAYAVNQDGRRWGIDQADSLHFGDAGHAMKAGIVAKHLFRDTFIVTDQVERLSAHDSRAANIGSYLGLTDLAKVTPGSNINYSASAPALGTAVMTAWVWNEYPNTELIYRGIANEEYAAAGTANAPKVRVTEMVGGVATSRVPAAVGFFDDGASGTYRKSDLPYRFGHLPYGLSKVEYLSGDSANELYYGHFEFRQTPRSRGRNGLPKTNALKDIGFFQNTFGATGNQAVLLPEAEDFSNVFGLMYPDVVDIFYDVTLPRGAGFVLGSCQTWATGTEFGDRVFGFMYRHTDDKIRLYNGIRKADGTVTYSSSLGESAAAVSWSSDRAKFRCRIGRTSGDNQSIAFYPSYTSTSASLTVGLAYNGPGSIPFAGAVGGLFWNADAAGGAGTAQIHEVLIHRQ